MSRGAGVIAMCAALVLVACEKSGADGGSKSDAESDATSADGSHATGSATGLTYAPGVVTMEAHEAIGALKEISANGALYLFGRNSTIAALKPGSVLLIKSVLAAKVLAVEVQDNGDVAVLTEPAGIGDVIDKGHLQFNYPVRFGSGKIINTSLATRPDAPWYGNLLVDNAYAADNPPTSPDAPSTSLGKTFNVKGWTVEVTASPEQGKINLKVRATKEGNGYKAVIIGDGYLQNFDAGGDLTIEHGTVETMEIVNKKLNGAMNFSWSVKLDIADRPFGNVKIDLPSLVNIPLAPVLGGLPFFLVIDGAVLIKPGLAGAEELSYGEFRITYAGTQRFRVKQGNVDPEGNVTGTIELVKFDNLMKVAPIAMVVGFAAPKIELTFGLSKALPTLGDFAKPAAIADKLFDKLGRRVFGDEKIDKLKDVNIEKALDVIKGNEASASFELVSSSGTSAGVLMWGPCQQTDLYVSATVNANAKFLGTSAGDVSKELFKKHIHASKPPNKECTA